jgi:DHA1 family 2-module integral membrane pump EmrD-like MFS transporter
MQSIEPVTFEEFKILLVTVMFAICGMLGLDIHLASLPHIMTYMHTDEQHMQQSVSIFLLGMGGSLLFYGPLSDKYGRKPIVIFGLAFASLSSFISAFSTNITVFLFLRLLQGIGSGVCIGVGRIIIADVLQGDRFSAIGSYFSMFISLSPILAPALGGYIQHWYGWQANFVTLGSILGAALLLYIFMCPETNKHINPNAFSVKGLYQNYKSLLMHPIFVGATLITGIAMAANMAYATISPFIFQIQFHLSPVTYGWLTAIAGVGGFVGKFVTPLSLRTVGSQQTLRIGLVLLFLSGMWMLFFILLKAINIPLIMIAVFFTIFSQSFITPIATSLALSPFHEKRGTAGALYGSFQMLTAFLSSALVGSIAQDGVIVLAVAYCILGFIGISIYISLAKKMRLVSTTVSTT